MHMDAQSPEVSLGTTRRRLGMLAGVGLLLGSVGGVAADVVVHLVGLISNLALLHRFGWQLPNLRHYHPTPVCAIQRSRTPDPDDPGQSFRLIPDSWGGDAGRSVMELWFSSSLLAGWWRVDLAAVSVAWW